MVDTNSRFEAPAGAQAPSGPGVLAASSSPSVASLYEELRQGLREPGYVEGKNIAMEYRYAEGRFERFPELAASLVSMNVDVIVALTTDAIVASQRATTTIPIVMPISLYRVELSIIKKPGAACSWEKLPYLSQCWNVPKD